MKNGGYAIISHDDINIFNKIDSAYKAGKPILFYDDDKTCFYVDSVKLNGDGDYVLIKGGKTITITDANTVSSTGSADAPTLENIKDLAGNLRFVEGNGELSEITGVEEIYNKWSLSGSHIMFVLSCNCANTTDIANLSSNYKLPSYIMDKIFPLYSSGIIEYKSLDIYDITGATSQSVATNFAKIDDETIRITIYGGSTTMTADRIFRIQFDLLIDAE